MWGPAAKKVDVDMSTRYSEVRDIVDCEGAVGTNEIINDAVNDAVG